MKKIFFTTVSIIIYSVLFSQNTIKLNDDSTILRFLGIQDLKFRSPYNKDLINKNHLQKQHGIYKSQPICDGGQISEPLSDMEYLKKDIPALSGSNYFFVKKVNLLDSNYKVLIGLFDRGQCYENLYLGSILIKVNTDISTLLTKNLGEGHLHNDELIWFGEKLFLTYNKNKKIIIINIHSYRGGDGNDDNIGVFLSRNSEWFINIKTNLLNN